MNFSSIPYRSFLGRIARLPLKIIPPNMKVRIIQGQLRGKKWIVGSSTHGCWLGSYEYEKQSLFVRTVKKNSTVFDIGAHVGFYTLLSSFLVGPTGRVIAFEPSPRNLFYLREHLRLNRVDNVEVIEAAVTNFSGKTSFSEGLNNAMGHIESTGVLEVSTVKLDDRLAAGTLPVPGYIKMDIEGAEVLALEGARNLLLSSHPTIFLATHGHDVNQACCRLLASLDYKLEPIDGKSLDETHEVLAYYA